MNELLNHTLKLGDAAFVASGAPENSCKAVHYNVKRILLVRRVEQGSVELPSHACA